ncbi:MAG: GIY-YIG nuclease family protein [Candidatus Marinimicrobia bacterium]|nr:GIY-YIG nuclease family protein [Candidatus Neomarinimicrobiota bacterium]
MYQVYVLKSVTDNFHYIGHTKDISLRLNEHNRGKVRSTKAHRPYTVIYTENYWTKSAAQKREYYLKRGEGNQWLRNHLKELQVW